MLNAELLDEELDELEELGKKLEEELDDELLLGGKNELDEELLDEELLDKELLDDELLEEELDELLLERDELEEESGTGNSFADWRNCPDNGLALAAARA